MIKNDSSKVAGGWADPPNFRQVKNLPLRATFETSMVEFLPKEADDASASLTGAPPFPPLPQRLRNSCRHSRCSCCASGGGSVRVP